MEELPILHNEKCMENMTDAAFQAYVEKKHVIARARKLLLSLDQRHITSRKDWISLGQALHAIDPKSLSSEWRQWTSTKIGTLEAKKCAKYWARFAPKTNADINDVHDGQEWTTMSFLNSKNESVSISDARDPKKVGKATISIGDHIFWKNIWMKVDNISLAKKELQVSAVQSPSRAQRKANCHMIRFNDLGDCVINQAATGLLFKVPMESAEWGVAWLKEKMESVGTWQPDVSIEAEEERSFVSKLAFSKWAECRKNEKRALEILCQLSSHQDKHYLAKVGSACHAISSRLKEPWIQWAMGNPISNANERRILRWARYTDPAEEKQLRSMWRQFRPKTSADLPVWQEARKLLAQYKTVAEEKTGKTNVEALNHAYARLMESRHQSSLTFLDSDECPMDALWWQDSADGPVESSKSQIQHAKVQIGDFVKGETANNRNFRSVKIKTEKPLINAAVLWKWFFLAVAARKMAGIGNESKRSTRDIRWGIGALSGKIVRRGCLISLLPAENSEWGLQALERLASLAGNSVRPERYRLEARKGKASTTVLTVLERSSTTLDLSWNENIIQMTKEGAWEENENDYLDKSEICWRVDLKMMGISEPETAFLGKAQGCTVRGLQPMSQYTVSLYSVDMENSDETEPHSVRKLDDVIVRTRPDIPPAPTIISHIAAPRERFIKMNLNPKKQKRLPNTGTLTYELQQCKLKDRRQKQSAQSLRSRDLHFSSKDNTMIYPSLSSSRKDTQSWATLKDWLGLDNLSECDRAKTSGVEEMEGYFISPWQTVYQGKSMEVVIGGLRAGDILLYRLAYWWDGDQSSWSRFTPVQVPAKVHAARLSEFLPTLQSAATKLRLRRQSHARRVMAVDDQTGLPNNVPQAATPPAEKTSALHHVVDSLSQKTQTSQTENQLLLSPQRAAHTAHVQVLNEAADASSLTNPLLPEEAQGSQLASDDENSVGRLLGQFSIKDSSSSHHQETAQLTSLLFQDEDDLLTHELISFAEVLCGALDSGPTGKGQHAQL